MSRISVRDLARIAGVSRTTVSLALRGSGEVSAATRERIQALARQHDYRSHPAIRMLMQQVGRGRHVRDEEVIAFVRSGRDPGERAPGPLEMLDGARDEAHRLGYRLEVFWSGYQGKDAERLGRILYSRGVRGVLWGPMPYPHPQVRFPWHHFAAVACTLSTDVPNLPAVNIHHPRAMAMLLDELSRRGARRIGILLEASSYARVDYGWRTGADLYLYRGGRAHIAHLVLSGPPRPRSVAAWVRRERLDVLVTSNSFFDKTAFLTGLPCASLDVPKARFGEVSGLYQDLTTIGQYAVQLLAGRLANNALGLAESPVLTTVDAVFVAGDSLLQLR